MPFTFWHNSFSEIPSSGDPTKFPPLGTHPAAKSSIPKKHAIMYLHFILITPPINKQNLFLIFYLSILSHQV